MEYIRQHRKYKDGVDLAFIQGVNRDRGGRFARQLFTVRKISNLLFGILVVACLLMIGYLIGVKGIL